MFQIMYLIKSFVWLRYHNRYNVTYSVTAHDRHVKLSLRNDCIVQTLFDAPNITVNVT